MKWIEGSTKLTKGQHEVTERLTQGRDAAMLAAW